MTAHEWLATAPLYAAGALPPDERAAYEAHLAGCPVCRAELAELGEVAGLVARAAPAQAPPPHLRERILERARAEGGSGAAPGEGVHPIAGLASGSAGETAPGDGAVPPSRGRAPWLALAASVLLAVFAGTAWWLERDRRSGLEDRLVAEAASSEVVERRLVDLTATVARQDSLLDVVLGPDVRGTSLVSTGAPPSARMYWDPSTGSVVLAAHDLPPAPGGRTYQLWGIPAGGDPVSLGTFDTGPDGRAVAVMEMPAELSIDLGAVTEEPVGGSPLPTTTPFLLGSFDQAR